MSARKYQQTVERCACGAWPCIHKAQAGRTFVYQVSCPRCGVATAKTDSDQEAYSDWNDGRLNREDVAMVGTGASAEAAGNPRWP
jgi:hypothetical protein